MNTKRRNRIKLSTVLNKGEKKIVGGRKGNETRIKEIRRRAAEKTRN